MDEEILEQENTTSLADTEGDAGESQTAPETDAETSTEPENTNEGETGQESAVTIPVRFNHEDRTVTMEEAPALIQKGMLYEQNEGFIASGKAYEKEAPLREKLERLATSGGKTVEEMVDALIATRERIQREKFVEECNGNEELADRLMESWKREDNQKYDALQNERKANSEKLAQDEKEKLAEEFVELQKEFPQLKGFEDVPPRVLETAKEKGVSLLDAYLRHQLAENKKINQQKSTEAENKSGSIGSQRSGKSNGEVDPVIAAMLSGVRG